LEFIYKACHSGFLFHYKMAGTVIYNIKTNESVFCALLKDGCRCVVGFDEVTVASSEAKQLSAVTTIVANSAVLNQRFKSG